MAESAVEVFVQIAGEDVFAGRLWSHQRRAVESATFTYSDEYLQRDGYALDPALPLSAGQHQTRVGQALFGAFTDCSPDRWGRRLINRTEQARARKGRRRSTPLRRKRLSRIRDNCSYPDFPVIPTWREAMGVLPALGHWER